MASTSGKENIADGLIAGPSFSNTPKSSPKKSSRRTRSKSIGPGGLGGLEEPALKESSGNRRKSAFIPAVKSILASNDEDEKKRREARRKSLAKRRVSFAPEATLHTWDVVEYLRDATTSSASSDVTRRASTASHGSTPTSPAPDSDAEEPPSTPPEQAEDDTPPPGSSPANQRDLHQRKRRRSSGIPPMNFNNPEDVFSSSPLSGDSISPAKDDSISSDDDDDEEEEEAATARIEGLVGTNDSTESSARLDAALRQAATHADTQKLEVHNDTPMSLDEDNVTASSEPRAKRSAMVADQDQENIDPFLPTAQSQSRYMHSDDGGDENDDDEMSMDITRAMGRIVHGFNAREESPDTEDMSMDLTMPLGSIQAMSSKESTSRRKSLKRRASLQNPSQGSPAKRPASRRTSLRHRTNLTHENAPVEDQTMDLTVAIGGIKSSAESQHASARRNSAESSFGDETMDFTIAVGSIKPSQGIDMSTIANDEDEHEDMSMEFTDVIGSIRNSQRQILPTETAASPTRPSPARAKISTPLRSPRKSPGRDLVNHSVPPAVIVPQDVVGLTPKKSPRRSLAGTPNIPSLSEQIEKLQPSPFVRSTPQNTPKQVAAVSTPLNGASQDRSEKLPNDPIEAPILQRRRSSLSSVQFSPLAASREEPTLKSTALLSNNIKLLSTPRKQTLTSPRKRGMTPRKSLTPLRVFSPKKNTPTPKKTSPRKSTSPRKRVAFGNEPTGTAEDNTNIDNVPGEEVERISLQEFLDMTKIRFMDLSTTKRRHTAAPATFHDTEVDEHEESLDRFVVAAACVLPEFELYQHACHEMKKYISDGRHFVRTMEANVMEENPLLFSEYLTAPPDQRVVMDNQFKNLKTSARLDARGEWYSWRSTLLQDLKTGLLSTVEGFARDESILSGQEKLLDAALPTLAVKHETLSQECKTLQQRHDELNSCSREELEQARQQLIDTDALLMEKRAQAAQLQQQLAETEARIEAVKDRKVECMGEIRTAEHLREECRGWSTGEVNDLKAKVSALEREYGWSVTAASSTTITLTYINDLELYFQPSAFATDKDTPNASISLSYIGDSAHPQPRPLTTSKRFFLQLIRAHLHCIPQSQTRIADLLTFIKNGWTTALSVAEGVRWLEHSFITDEFILSDERMAISSDMLLPTLETKVRCTFEIGISLGLDSVETLVEPKAEIVYGEKYKADKMRDFLKDFCGDTIKKEDEMATWADAIIDLAGRLKATGRKGERA